MNHKVIVTGASRGIGSAITDMLIKFSCEVIGLARSFNESQKELPRFTPYSLDLSEVDTLPQSLKSLARKYKGIDTLICNAGQGLFGNLEELAYEQIQQLMNINFLSHVYLIKAFLPQMKRAKKGNIILIGSEAALAGRRQGSVYCASKFALRGFTQALREECASSGVRVTLINPGMVQTSFFDNLHFSPGDQVQESILPGDVAKVVEMILQTREGTVLDEINLSPQSKRVVLQGPPNGVNLKK